jgi:pectate lyase
MYCRTLALLGCALGLLGCTTGGLTLAPTASDIAHQVLSPVDGWAAAEGGTRGGADASAHHQFDVRNRAELVAALQSAGSQPKIIRVHGRIDLSVDDANRPLVAADYRDPAFDFEAYLQAYAPATWGKKPVAGPLEEARLRSVANQAARVVVRLPSNTTVVGVGREATLANGMLLLDKVDNIILRNLHFTDAFDYFQAWVSICAYCWAAACSTCSAETNLLNAELPPTSTPSRACAAGLSAVPRHNIQATTCLDATGNNRSVMVAIIPA